MKESCQELPDDAIQSLAMPGESLVMPGQQSAALIEYIVKLNWSLSQKSCLTSR